jgi:hypothetical protein
MRVRLGDFARSGLETELGPDVEAGVGAALEYCADQIGKDGQPIDFPSFLGESTASASGTEAELAVPREVERALEVEVSRQGISIAQLIEHAVFVYLARVDELQARG